MGFRCRCRVFGADAGAMTDNSGKLVPVPVLVPLNYKKLVSVPASVPMLDSCYICTTFNVYYFPKEPYFLFPCEILKCS